MVLTYLKLPSTCTQLLDSKYFNRHFPDNFYKFPRILAYQLLCCHSQGRQGMTGPAGKTGAQGAAVSKPVNRAKYRVLLAAKKSTVEIKSWGKITVS